MKRANQITDLSFLTIFRFGRQPVPLLQHHHSSSHLKPLDGLPRHILTVLCTITTQLALLIAKGNSCGLTSRNPPDILLSLGTGKNGQGVEEQIAGLDPLPGKQQQTTRSSNPDTAAKSKRENKPSWRRTKSYKRIAKHFSVLVRVPLCFRTWLRYC